MNREIKFRAWNGIDEMVYPRESSPKFHSGEFVKHFEEVMQFTGIKDKNGKDIYEGDIVRSNQLIGTYTITFLKGSFGLNGNNDAVGISDKIKNNSFHPIFFSNSNQLEVIGNIFENPEMIVK